MRPPARRLDTSAIGKPVALDARALDRLVRGLISAVVGGVIAYLLALYIPGGAVVTALLGMAVGGVVALAIVWQDFRLLLHL